MISIKNIFYSYGELQVLNNVNLSIKKGEFVSIIGASGAGKTTIVKLLSKKFNYQISISHTTRKPRKVEINRRDYFFINKSKISDSKEIIIPGLVQNCPDPIVIDLANFSANSAYSL